jgi:hypothetical protein
MTRLAQVLEVAMRKTLLPRVGNREALTHLQQWLLGALVSHTEFDVVDFLFCEIEDTVMDGRQCRQRPYAHYMCYIFERLIKFPQYAMTRETHPRRFEIYRPIPLGDDARHRDPDSDFVEQPETENPPDDQNVCDDLYDDEDDDNELPIFGPPPQTMTTCGHDARASSSRSAPTVPPAIDPSVAALLEKNIDEQQRLAAKQQRLAAEQ